MWRTVQFCSVAYVYMGQKRVEINYLLPTRTVLSMRPVHLLYRSRYVDHLWNLCRCLSQIHHGGVG